MERFAYVCKFCIYAKFAHVCKSLHVYRPLDIICSFLIEPLVRTFDQRSGDHVKPSSVGKANNCLINYLSVYNVLLFNYLLGNVATCISFIY